MTNKHPKTTPKEGKYLKKENPVRIARDYNIAIQAANGKTPKQIAADLPIQTRQVINILADNKAIAIIKRTTKRYIAASTGTSKRHIKLCFDDDKKLSLDAIKEVNRIIGISQSHTPPGVANFYSIQQNNVVHPDIIEILRKHNVDEEHVLDGEFEDVEQA